MAFPGALDVWDEAAAHSRVGSLRLDRLAFPPAAFDQVEFSQNVERLTEMQHAQPAIAAVALSQLALRIVPYLGWARTNNTESAGLSRYFLKEYGGIEGKLKGQVLPHRLNDAERAQLLLGYLATNVSNKNNQVDKSIEKGESNE